MNMPFSLHTLLGNQTFGLEQSVDLNIVNRSGSKSVTNAGCHYEDLSL